MLKVIRPPIICYGVAVLSVILALILNLLLATFIGSKTLAIFFASVAVSNWYGGFKPGLVATILSVLLHDYFFTLPIHSISPFDLTNIFTTVVFVFVSLLMSSLTTELRIAKKRAQNSLAEAESKRKEVVNILESITDAFVSFDNEWRFVYVNEQARKLLQKTRQELIGKQIWKEVFPSIFGELVYQELHRAVVEQTKVEFEDFVESISIWLEIHAYPSANGISVYFRDISERKQIEQERAKYLVQAQENTSRLQNLADEAQKANRIKDEFLAMLSHELRSPLNAILGWSQLLHSGKLNQEQRMCGLETIERNAKLQTQLIEDLLDISRILNGKISLNISPINPVLPINAAINTMYLAAEEKSIQLLTAIDFNVGMISGDSQRLQQIVWNLLSNAIKFTPAGGRVEIQLTAINSQVQIKVSDTGKGIKSNFLPYVFDRFCQADTSITRSYGGLGLGLAIVRQLVELQGGTVMAESLGEGQGATFTVRFPLLKQQPVMKQISTLSNHPPNNINGVKVLVIDDDFDTRKLLVFILEQHGAIALAKASVREGIECLEQFQPDVLVSDIGMPEEDGYSFIRKVRELASTKFKQIPAVALTAYASTKDYEQALQAGFQKHISKPVNTDELITNVANLVATLK